MTAKQYLLVAWEPGLTVEMVEKVTGMRGSATPDGVLIEKPQSNDRIRSNLAAIQKAFEPRPACNCHGVLHRPDCPIGGGIT